VSDDRQSQTSKLENHCFNRKNKFPAGGVMVTLFVPLAVFTLTPQGFQPAALARLSLH
jgi:hypothetical protein